MTALATSPRTILRNTVMEQFLARKNQASVRVKTFAVSPNYLVEQETKQAHTYCVLVTDEQIQHFTMTQFDSSATLKLVLYAHDPADPRSILDAMIEDALDVVRGLMRHDLSRQTWKITPDSISTDEATTAAGPWAQAVCQWTVRLSRA